MDKSAIDLYQNDIRLRMIAQSAVAEALRESRPIDPERADKDVHDIALLAVVTALKRAFDEDPELTAARIERDHYKTIAEQALRMSPLPMVITSKPANNSA